MRRRLAKFRYLVFGLFLAIAILAVFTQVLLPLESFMLDTAASFVLAVRRAPLGQDATQPSLSHDEVRIIAKNSNEFQDVLLINKSLPEGTKIIVGEVLVGFISEQGIRASKARLITSPFFKVHGVFARSGIPATFEGKGASVLEARLPRGSDITVGDVVYHDEGELLVIGNVVQIIDEPSSVFLTIYVQHAVNSTNLNIVQYHDT